MFICKEVPIVDAVPKFTPPPIVTLAKVMVPVTVPVPAKATVPVPPVKVLAPLAKVPPLAMVRVPPLVITTEPLLVKVVVVRVPVPEGLFNVRDLVLFTVIAVIALATALFTVTI